MAIAVILLPMLLAALAFAVPSNRWRPLILPAGGVAHLAITLWLATHARAPLLGDWLYLDDLGCLVLLLVSVLFMASSWYAVGYLRHEEELSNRVFCGCLLAFLGSMTLLTCSHHWGLMWVAMEATTLVSAPLICFNRTALSLEATWKYLLICSVGIALALLGSFFLAYAALHEGLPSSLMFDDLLRSASKVSRPWLNAAFVLLLVGYGTKMGLAPLHTWLPDAHGEAPAPVSALLSGALLPCAFLPILRAYQMMAAAGQAVLAQRILIAVGLLSMLVTAVFVLRQRDLKRMLAYSSVEHMGILALGVGIGGGAVFGALFHILNNGLTKSVLFLSSGNIYLAYGSKSIDHVSGVRRRLPLTGLLFVAGFLAITGSPPFGPFQSLFAIVNAAFVGGRYIVVCAFLLLLFVVFIGMGATVLAAVQGRPPEQSGETKYRDSLLSCLPIVLLLVLVLLLGVYMPDSLRTLLQNAAKLLEARP